MAENSPPSPALLPTPSILTSAPSRSYQQRLGNFGAALGRTFRRLRASNEQPYPQIGDGQRNDSIEEVDVSVLEDMGKDLDELNAKVARLEEECEKRMISWRRIEDSWKTEIDNMNGKIDLLLEPVDQSNDEKVVVDKAASRFLETVKTGAADLEIVLKAAGKPLDRSELVKLLAAKSPAI